MAYNEELVSRVRRLLLERPDCVEKKMFGGLCFLLRGNMACGLLNDDLIVRVGAEKFAEALEQPGTRLFDVTGRPMKGWVMVSPEGCDSDAALAVWVARGVSFALSLPPK